MIWLILSSSFRNRSRYLALRGFEWVSAWLSGIMPSGAPPPTPWRSPPRGSGERRALTPLLSPNHRLFARNRLVNLLSRHMLGLTACAIPRQFDDSIPRRNYPHESAKGQIFLPHSTSASIQERVLAVAVVRHTSTSICLVHLKLLQGPLPCRLNHRSPNMQRRGASH